LMSHVVIEGHTTIGSGCNIFPFACLGGATQDLKYKGDITFVEIGDNTTIRENVTVNSGTNEGEVTRVGSRCLLMAYSHVAHACRLGDEVIMANCATLAGDVQVDDQAILGGLCAVHQFTRIGRMCIVGGCTKVSQDCPPFMMIDGNPAATRGLNSIGLKRRGVDEKARKLLKEAYRFLYRKNLSTSQALAVMKERLERCEEVDDLMKFIEKSERGIVK
jgi:UDP-N-acetylglucosamine acyltransferase